MNFIEFINPGILLKDVPLNLISDLNFELQNIKKIPYNQKLAGNIKNEYQFSNAHNILNNFLLNTCEEYNKKYDYIKTISFLTNDVPLVLQKEDLWINFQKKYEFNPVHNHTGVYSFVIWLKVPFLMEDEIKLSPGNYSNKPVSGNFEILYTSALGETSCMQLPVDKTFEGKMLFFPAKLSHQVYPFYSSDDERISISGNIKLKSNGN